MTLTRLFATLLLLFPLAAFAQDQQGRLNFSPEAAPDVGEAARPAPAEPWRIMPKTDLYETDKSKVADTTCYAIRSYVVARDDKDSDSTHFVRYSTCQPASRYRLKTAQVEGSAVKLR